MCTDWFARLAAKNVDKKIRFRRDQMSRLPEKVSKKCTVSRSTRSQAFTSRKGGTHQDACYGPVWYFLSLFGPVPIALDPDDLTSWSAPFYQEYSGMGSQGALQAVKVELQELQLPHIRQSSGLSRLQAIASRLSASSARSARPPTVWSSFVEASTVNWMASAAALVRR